MNNEEKEFKQYLNDVCKKTGNKELVVYYTSDIDREYIVHLKIVEKK